MPVLRGPEGGRHKKYMKCCKHLKQSGAREIFKIKKKPIVVVAGKWRIGEDLLPRNMTVTVEPNGREFFPAYCAGCLGTFHKIFNKHFC